MSKTVEISEHPDSRDIGGPSAKRTVAAKSCSKSYKDAKRERRCANGKWANPTAREKKP